MHTCTLSSDTRFNGNGYQKIQKHWTNITDTRNFEKRNGERRITEENKKTKEEKLLRLKAGYDQHSSPY